ncbi:MAG: hypothetical protein WD276_06575 [Actinomycetota bacterium]
MTYQGPAQDLDLLAAPAEAVCPAEERGEQREAARIHGGEQTGAERDRDRGHLSALEISAIKRCWHEPSSRSPGE